MQLFTALQLLDLCALLVCATAILVRDSKDRGNRAAAALLYCGAIWSAGQLLWNSTDDRHLALRMVRASAVGWIALGPLIARFIVEVTNAPAPRLRRALPFFFGVAGVSMALDWWTPWVHAGVVRTSWGWGYVHGPLYPVIYLSVVGSFVWGLAVAIRAYRESTLESERSQGLWIAGGILQLLVVGSLTDAILPWFGHPVPQLATTGYALMGVIFAWSMRRFGYSILSPGTFAAEITECMGEGLVLLRLDGRIRSVNAGLVKMLGLPREQVLVRRVDDLLTLPLIEPPQEVREARTWLRGPAGQHIPVSVTTTLLRDARGVDTGLAVMVRDLREIEALQQRLVLSGRMVAVGQLAAGVAHEVNNPTSYVRSNMLLLREYWQSAAELLDPKLSADGGELIDESLEGIERIASIVQQIGRFSSGAGDERERADLNLILDSALRMARPRLGELQVERSPGELPEIDCAPRELEQVFLNLLLNAADAVGGAGTIRIAGAVFGARARVDVADDGTGIAPELLARVFDPFFTTKPAGAGVGLGLSLCQRMILANHGTIRVDSEVGHGTSVTITLPVHEEAVQTQTAA
jgi:PAS domain S-box-containing protein